MLRHPVNFFQIFEFDFEDGEDLQVGQRHLENPLVLVQLLAQLVYVVQLRPENKLFILNIMHYF